MNDSAKEKVSAYQKLNVVWGVLTSFFLLLVLYFIWHGEQQRIDEQVGVATQKISNNMDNLIDNLTQSIYSSNLNTHDFLRCDKNTLLTLNHLVVNVPQISGLTIINKDNKILCSTLPKTSEYVAGPNDLRPLSLYGPLTRKGIDQSVYALQQKLGEDRIEIYMISQDLEKLLKSKLEIIKSIVLYDQQRQKVLLKITRTPSPHNAWHRSESSHLPTNIAALDETNKRFSRNELIRLDHVDVIVEKDELQLTSLSLRYVLMGGSVLLLMSVAIYFYLRRIIHHHFSLHRALVNGIKNNEFYPVYQPIMDRRNNQCCGAEVLVRWQTALRETIMPDTFIDYAEQSGLIVPITLQLSEKVFSECQSFLYENPDFHLSINLSSIHFTDTPFLEKFIALCKHYRIRINQIILEVTERDLLQYDLSLVAKMKELREAGFSLAIDDFGTGHASISYLERFPFNYLKMDRIFVSAIGTGAVTEALNLSIIDMANRLGLYVIAEGVETFEQLEALEQKGTFLMQGWYFSKALVYEKLILYIKRNS